MAGSDEKERRMQSSQVRESPKQNCLQNDLPEKILDHVEVKLEFPKRLGGDIAKIRWITLYYDAGETVDDDGYCHKLAKYDFFPEHDTQLETYQEIIDRMAEHYHTSKAQIYLI